MILRYFASVRDVRNGLKSLAMILLILYLARRRWCSVTWRLRSRSLLQVSISDHLRHQGHKPLLGRNMYDIFKFCEGMLRFIRFRETDFLNCLYQANYGDFMLPQSAVSSFAFSSSADADNVAGTSTITSSKSQYLKC